MSSAAPLGSSAQQRRQVASAPGTTPDRRLRASTASSSRRTIGVFDRSRNNTGQPYRCCSAIPTAGSLPWKLRYYLHQLRRTSSGSTGTIHVQPQDLTGIPTRLDDPMVWYWTTIKAKARSLALEALAVQQQLGDARIVGPLLEDLQTPPQNPSLDFDQKYWAVYLLWRKASPTDAPADRAAGQTTFQPPGAPTPRS